MVVPIRTKPMFEAETPRLLFEWPGVTGVEWSYDVSPDGQRFVMTRAHSDNLTQLSVVLDWFEKLKRLVPTEN